MPLNSKRGNILIRLLRQVVFILCDLAGINYIFNVLNKGKIKILMYHGVTSYRFKALCWPQVGLKNFKWQMTFLKSRYNVLPSYYLINNSYSSKNMSKNSVIITFDDGFENNYSQAWPVLKKLNLHATCFVLPNLSRTGKQMWVYELYSFFLDSPNMVMELDNYGLGNLDLNGSLEKRFELYTKLVETLKHWPHEKRKILLNHIFSKASQTNSDQENPFKLMTPQQIVKLSQSKEFDIGVHSNNHLILSTLSPEEQEEEIRSSIDMLKSWKISFIPIFAYPNGRLEDFDSYSIGLLRKMGIKAALTTIYGFWNGPDDNYRIKRIPIGGDTTKWEFKALLSGLHFFLKNIVNKHSK